MALFSPQSAWQKCLAAFCWVTPCFVGPLWQSIYRWAWGTDLAKCLTFPPPPLLCCCRTILDDFPSVNRRLSVFHRKHINLTAAPLHPHVNVRIKLHFFTNYYPGYLLHQCQWRAFTNQILHKCTSEHILSQNFYFYSDFWHFIVLASHNFLQKIDGVVFIFLFHQSVCVNMKEVRKMIKATDENEFWIPRVLTWFQIYSFKFASVCFLEVLIFLLLFSSEFSFRTITGVEKNIGAISENIFDFTTPQISFFDESSLKSQTFTQNCDFTKNTRSLNIIWVQTFLLEILTFCQNLFKFFFEKHLRLLPFFQIFNCQHFILDCFWDSGHHTNILTLNLQEILRCIYLRLLADAHF